MLFPDGETVMKILVVDGDESVVHLMKKILGKAGYEVVGTTRCDSAVDAVKRYNFDLILVDVTVSEAWKLRRGIINGGNSPQVLMMGAMPAYFYDGVPEDFDRSKYVQKLLPKERLLSIIDKAIRNLHGRCDAITI